MARTRSSHPLRAALLLAALAALTAAPATAQKLDRALPDVASPGDLVILRGTGLDQTSAVRFTGFVGGFAGMLSQDVVPLSVTATEVRAVLPTIGAFVGPNATPPSGPVGQVRTLGGGESGPLDFFFTEETMGALQTVGNGTTQSNGKGRPVISFDLKKGPPKIPPAGVVPTPPKVGNPNFTPRLENAPPSSVAALLIGVPAAPPFALSGDGLLVVDLAGPLLVLVLPTDGIGDAEVLLPVPSNVSGTVMLQWAAFDPGLPAVFALSNGLQAAL